MSELAQFTRHAVQQALNALERALGVNPIPGLRDTDLLELLRYLRPIQREAAKVGFSAGSYTHGATADSAAYVGGVFSPTQNRIYLVPYSQGDNPVWHYIDCSTGEVVAYTHLATAVASAYVGGVYSPTQNRIYFIPYSQASNSDWHYVDCSTGEVVAYTHGVTAVQFGYKGGVYSPTQNRIYLTPYRQAAENTWHYIDCDTETVEEYTHGTTAVDFAYIGAVYSPTLNRIYFVPYSQASEANWHYIDCDTETVEEYANGVSAQTQAYSGGVYSPTLNRIYFVPSAQAPEANWHYIDCDTTTVEEYANGIPVALSGSAYSGGVYSPTQNRIYLIPQAQAPNFIWHYIDCDTETVEEYANGISPAAQFFGYDGGVYSPTQNRIYLVPYAQADESFWNYIQEYSDIPVSRNLMAGALFNKL